MAGLRVLSLLSLPLLATGHGALYIPTPRNALESVLPEFADGKSPTQGNERDDHTSKSVDLLAIHCYSLVPGPWWPLLAPPGIDLTCPCGVAAVFVVCGQKIPAPPLLFNPKTL